MRVSFLGHDTPASLAAAVPSVSRCRMERVPGRDPRVPLFLANSIADRGSHSHILRCHPRRRLVAAVCFEIRGGDPRLPKRDLRDVVRRPPCGTPSGRPPCRAGTRPPRAPHRCRPPHHHQICLHAETQPLGEASEVQTRWGRRPLAPDSGTRPRQTMGQRKMMRRRTRRSHHLPLRPRGHS